MIPPYHSSLASANQMASFPPLLESVVVGCSCRKNLRTLNMDHVFITQGLHCYNNIFRRVAEFEKLSEQSENKISKQKFLFLGVGKLSRKERKREVKRKGKMFSYKEGKKEWMVRRRTLFCDVFKVKSFGRSCSLKKWMMTRRTPL